LGIAPRRRFHRHHAAAWLAFPVEERSGEFQLPLGIQGFEISNVLGSRVLADLQMAGLVAAKDDEDHDIPLFLRFQPVSLFSGRASRACMAASTVRPPSRILVTAPMIGASSPRSRAI